VNLVASDKVELSESAGNLMVLAQNQENQLPTQSSQDFPIIPKMENADVWQVAVENLATGLGQLVEIPATSQLHPSITGLLFDFKGGQLTMVATDSFRLAEKKMPTQKDGKKEGSFILPQAPARELLNILGQEQGQVNIYFNTNQVMFELLAGERPKIRVQSRLVEGDYPKYQEIIPQSSTTQIRLERELLSNQVKQAGLFSGKVAGVRLKAMAKEGKIKISSQSAEMGRSESYVLAQVNGPEVEIAFNFRFLLAGLNSLKSSEVLMELSGTDRAGVIRPVGDTSCLYLLMPTDLAAVS
jgi:DNA polymerase-3 subunit beta